jgi:K+:H+ antiporter
MGELTFLRDLAVVMAVSAGITVLFHVVRQPVVLGYLVAGVLIGPHTPLALLPLAAKPRAAAGDGQPTAPCLYSLHKFLRL